MHISDTNNPTNEYKDYILFYPDQEYIKGTSPLPLFLKIIILIWKTMWQ